jgi:hypothetical protein
MTSLPATLYQAGSHKLGNMADGQPGKALGEEFPIFTQIQSERQQAYPTRRDLFVKIEELLGRPVVSYFTSFNYPVIIDNYDVGMIEGVLRSLDLENGLALFISSRGGDTLAAERIINICRSYSGTGDYWAIVPGMAKSAATMICFGASKIIMSAASELGPVDPQVTISEQSEPGKPAVANTFSVYFLVKSYNKLFNAAVKEKGGNLQPYLQQLQRYDARQIEEYKAACKLSEDMAVRALSTGMMKDKAPEEIKGDIKLFLTPEELLAHGRPIYKDEARACKLTVEEIDAKDPLRDLVYELYTRTNGFVSTNAAKCVESKKNSFSFMIQR